MKAESTTAYDPIGNYAIIGDCRCAALVSKSGSIDWLCLPRFDHPAVFSALLDSEKGGSFQIQPAQRFVSRRNYITGTNVLETTFRNESGKIRLTDFMPIYDRDYMRKRLCPQRHILRKIEGIQGEVEVAVSYRPVPEYGIGRKAARLVDRKALGIYCEVKNGTMVFNGEIPLQISPDHSMAEAFLVVKEGQRFFLSLVFAEGEPAILPALGEESETALGRTVDWWKTWASKCTYRGPYREAIVRSFLTLKLLSFAPSGAVIAAPTTSLPEKIGGVRNWDYRFCWLRDAAMTIRAFTRLGYDLEAEAFLAWIIHSTRLSRPEFKVLYNVYGEMRIREKEVCGLDGYASSRPVRIGNDARHQLQLDTYGEVVVATFEYFRKKGHLDRATRRMLLNIGNTVCRRWKEPDEGIWELRSGRHHNTYSKAMCWVALDILLRLHRQGVLQVPEKRFQKERDAIRSQVEDHAYSDVLHSYVAEFGEALLDGSLLLLPIYGYARPDAPRMVSTCRQIENRLGKNGLIYRYDRDDGMPAGEGAFGACSFWAVECAARRGKPELARRRFDHLMTFANDVGLFSEEIDPETGAALGNFPQAFTHVALINAAIAIGGEHAHPPINNHSPP